MLDLPEHGEPTREAMQLKILADYDLAWPGDPGFSDPERWLPGKRGLDAPLSLSSGKSLLIVSHELSRTGAPLILLEIAKALKSSGYNILTLSAFEGPLPTKKCGSRCTREQPSWPSCLRSHDSCLRG